MHIAPYRQAGEPSPVPPYRLHEPPQAPDDSSDVTACASGACSWRQPPATSAGHGNAVPAPLIPDFDGIWKYALQTWLPDCLGLFWPDIHARIDWKAPPVFLDKELKRLDRIIKKDSRRVDVLVESQLASESGALLLIHFEMQAGRVDARFPQRMFRYRIRLYEKYPEHAILSCAILLDRKTGPEIGTFHSKGLGLGDELIFCYPVVYLLQWRDRMAKLKKMADTNPFAVVVMAQLECRATRPDAKRLARKLKLARALEHSGYDAQARWALFLVMDSLLALPEPLEERFNDIMVQTGDPVMMQQLNSLQRVRLRREKAASLEKGLREGKLEGAAALLQTQIQRKFGPIPDWAAVRIAQASTEAVQQWGLKMLDAERIEDVFGS